MEKLLNFVKNRISIKILIVFMGTSAATVFILTTVIFFVVRSNVKDTASLDLRTNVNTIHSLIESNYSTLINQLRITAQSNTAIGKQLIRRNRRNAKVLLTQFINSQNSKAQYTFCHNSRGIIQVHPVRRVVGRNLYKYRFIRESIRRKNGTVAYMWKNPGEKKARPKIIAFSYLRAFDWHICVSAYIDSFMNKKIVSGKSIRQIIKDISIGKTGYVYIMNSKGKVILHPKIEGQSLADKSFAQYIIKNKTSSTHNTYSYIWEGRPKIVAFRYFKPLDWIVVAGKETKSTFNNTMKDLVLSYIIMIPLLTIGMIFIFLKFLDRIIIRPINFVKKVTQTISKGDYTITIRDDIKSQDEIGIMMKSLSQMVDIQKGIVNTINDYIEKLSTSSESMENISKRMVTMSQDQAASMEEASAALEETLSSMEQINERSTEQYNRVDKNSGRMAEMAQEAKDSYDEALYVSELMGQSASKAGKGEEDLNSMVREMQNIKDSTAKIEEIIKIISDISEQVNLLSLNAAIEAARAGEHGKGFAVVADEISKLAEETATSAKTITQLVSEGNERADAGTEIVNRTAGTFHEIIESIENVSGAIERFSKTMKLLADTSSEAQERTGGIKQISQNISSATEEQMTTNKEISSTIEKVNEDSQVLVDYADTISNTSDEIRGIALELKERLSNFKA